MERSLAAVDNSLPISYTSIWTDALETQFSATHFMPLKTASVLQNGRYQVRMQLASGGLSAVYLAKTETGNRVVLKESVLPIDTDQRTKKKAKELFEREGKLLARLDHPQVAKVLDFFVENGRDYLVLEFIPGVSLRQYIRSNSKRDLALIANWSYQILQIIDYLHALQPPVIHRDLTPDNLLATDDGKIVLIDFGVSNEFVSKATGTLVGKQAYIPPEQFRGKAEPKSDIYAFGATLYFLLTGEDPVPLSISNPSTVTNGIPAALNELVVHCTQTDPDSRPTAAEAAVRVKQLVDNGIH
ncbi:MAG: serine/threonine protein kinase [Leptolyngbya sp.]|nr:serine/threonine protein kinase [Candidatus Melainabacteria bacterium]